MPAPTEAGPPPEAPRIDEYDRPHLPPRERRVQLAGNLLAGTAAVLFVVNLVIAVDDGQQGHLEHVVVSFLTAGFAVAALASLIERLSRYGRSLNRRILRDIGGLDAKVDDCLAQEFMRGTQAKIDRIGEDVSGKVTSIGR